MAGIGSALYWMHGIGIRDLSARLVILTYHLNSSTYVHLHGTFDVSISEQKLSRCGVEGNVAYNLS